MNGVTIILLQELCLLINVLICFGIPILGIIMLNKKYGKAVKPFIIGMVTFVISQPLIRIPILQFVLPNYLWFTKIQYNPYLYGIFLGLTAGLFEEVARLIFMKNFLKGRTSFKDGLAFGLGHGGIEAMIFIGLNSVVTMVLAPIGISSLTDSDYIAVLLGGFERILAMAFHTGATLIVLYGIKTHKSGRYTILAILLHTLLDSMVVILPSAIHLGTAGLYIYILVISVLTLALGIRMFVPTVSRFSNSKVGPYER